MEKEFSRENQKRSAADGKEVREGILECLGGGEVCIRKEIREYLKHGKHCSLSEATLTKYLHNLLCSKKICLPQKGYYIREEEEGGSKVFWKLWECRRELEKILSVIQSADKNDTDIACEIENMEKIVGSLRGRLK